MKGRDAIHQQRDRDKDSQARLRKGFAPFFKDSSLLSIVLILMQGFPEIASTERKKLSPSTAGRKRGRLVFNH